MQVLNEEADRTLRIIGKQLDLDVFPLVRSGGYVAPSSLTTYYTNRDKEQYDERSKSRGSATGSRKGTTGGQGPAGGSGSAGKTESSVFTDLASAYCEQLDDIETAYPGLRVWQQPGGIWLLISAGLIRGSLITARFLVAVPFDDRVPMAWAFWGDGSWIGPRHTNFKDGSICCMHIPDNTWAVGEPLVDLLDLFTLWAVRHLYVRLFGRWPGRQVAILRHERLTEISDDELCGCGSAIPYGACCKKDDLKRNKMYVAIEFVLYGRERAVPKCIWRFVNGQSEPPQFDELDF